ncbi:MAG TPA: YihY/virulence factor BrkB family protein [Gaiellaceae bacterium]|nr:YihY/virulence factor BrkB family protein [Gaiellaceae bacterium]
MRGRRHGLVARIWAAFVEHNLLTYAAAIAFQGLIALVPLTLFALGLLGATGHRALWTEHIAPAIEGRVTQPVFAGIDDTVRRILDHGTAGLIAVASIMSVWYLTAAMRAVIEALDTIHDVRDKRSWKARIVTAVALGTVSGACLFGAATIVVGGPRGILLGLARWAAALVLVAIVVGLLLRFAPAQRPDAGWATLGAGVIVVAWVIASVLFGVWVTYVADFTSPIGTLTTLLVLTSYLFTSAVVFLAGAQLDELLRKSGSA